MLAAVSCYADFFFARFFVVKRNIPGDFDLYYRGGQMLLSGERNIYSKEVYRQFFKNDPEVAKEHYFYFNKLNYPPLIYAAFSPFCRWRPERVKSAWFYLNCLLLIASVALLFFLKPAQALPWKLKGPAMALVLFYCFLFSPVNENLFRGQVNILLLFFLALTVFFYDRRWSAAAGAALGAAAAVKILPGFLFLAFFIRKDYRAIIWGLLAILFLYLAVVAAFGPGVIDSYLSNRDSSYSSLYSNVHPFNKSIPAMLTRLFSRGPSWRPLIDAPFLVFPITILLSAFVLAASVGLGLVLARQIEDGPAAGTLTILLFSQALFLLSPLVFAHHMVTSLMLLPMFVPLLLQYKKPGGISLSGCVIMLAAVAALGIFAGIIPDAFHFDAKRLWEMRIAFQDNFLGQITNMAAWGGLAAYIYGEYCTAPRDGGG
jgi:hypothetical protein